MPIAVTHASSYSLPEVADVDDNDVVEHDLGSLDLAGADLLIVATATTVVRYDPIVIYGGEVLRPIGFARSEVTAGAGPAVGALAVFALKAPPAGVNALAVQDPFGLGFVQVAVLALSGTSGDIGIAWQAEQDGLTSGEMACAPEDAGSLRLLFGRAFFEIPAETVTEDWTLETSTDNEGESSENQLSVYSATNSAGGTVEVELDVPAQALWQGIEVFAAGVTNTAATVEVVHAEGLEYGWIATSAISRDVVLPEHDLLLICASTNNFKAPPPKLTINGVEIPFTSKFYQMDNFCTLLFWATTEVAAGEAQITLTGYTGFAGHIMATVTALAGTTGQALDFKLASEIVYDMRLPLEPAADDRNLYLALTCGYWHSYDAPVLSYGWAENASVQMSIGNQEQRLSVHSGRARYGGAADIIFPVLPAQATQKAFLFQFSHVPGAAEVEGTMALPVPAPQLEITGEAETPVPSGQKLKLHWDPWNGEYTPQFPDTMFFTHIPRYIDTVNICFVRPLCTYARLDDDLTATAGIEFPPGVTCTGRQLKAAMDLLRSRHPEVHFSLVVQQGGADLALFEPYNPDGFGGMTEDHFASIKKLADDLGIDHIDLDYECVSLDVAFDKHCYLNEYGETWCYTDEEYVSVVKAFRAHFPRPNYTLFLDCYNSAAYFGPYDFEAPIGWNHGYVACLTKDEEAFDAIDGIHIMSFDEPLIYDPIRALEAYMHHFPGKEIYLGMRTGYPWPAGYPDLKRTLAEDIRYINAAAKMGAAGMWIYSLLWDVAGQVQDFRAEYPDGNMLAQLTAKQYGLPDAGKPLISDGSMKGGFVIPPMID